MIPKETIDKIFETARVEEVVGEYVNLKKRGANLIGLCPFHNEKTPSFSVSPAKGIYKCFGCGKAGNSVNFLMDHDKMSYVEALKHLAKKYNIEIVEKELTPEEQVQQGERESLFIVSAFAQKFFSDNLTNTEEGKAIGLSYFKERGFRDDIIEKFQLGYSPEKRNALATAAIEGGYKPEFLTKAGLIIARENESQLIETESAKSDTTYFDRFSGRVMFPIHNATGRVIGFGGRILRTDKKLAKYVNSPESEIYHKSNVLYGLFFAKNSITKHDACFLVEGYTDVISMHQAGIENVVASSGTSLTVEQIRLIKRYTNNITILYDGDAAGIKASFRGINLVLEEGMNVRVLLFPDGEDPDSYSKKVSSDELKTFIDKNTTDFISFKTQLLLADTQNDPIKKAALIQDIVESIALIPDGIKQTVYIKECSRLMKVAEEVLFNEISKIKRKRFFDGKNQHQNRQENITPLSDSGQNSNESISPEIVDSFDENEWQEKDIVRLLVKYGSTEIEIDALDNDGKEILFKTKIAEHIIHELRDENIKLNNVVYQNIVDEFEKHIANSTIPDEKYFTTHSEKEISDCIINIVSSPHLLSTNWQKHGISIQEEEHILSKSTQSAIFSLKAKHLNKMIEEKQKELSESADDIQIIAALNELNVLNGIKTAFNKRLGRVIIK